ncbi:hypothetical protein PspLS_09350 [Pyricularia sp. CBS 133598]|nr:hypothetical protein PspLS_09350 [Pyricularia sp. CBS 133598]
MHAHEGVLPNRPRKEIPASNDHIAIAEVEPLSLAATTWRDTALLQLPLILSIPWDAQGTVLPAVDAQARGSLV